MAKPAWAGFGLGNAVSGMWKWCWVSRRTARKRRSSEPRHPIIFVVCWSPSEGNLKSNSVTRTLSVGLLLLSRPVLGGGGAQHNPIVIQNDSDFVSCACVLGGDGSL